MKKYTIVILITVLFIVGCNVSEKLHSSPLDGCVLKFSDIGTLFYTEWNGHRYVCRNDYHRGGITHDPDCPYCKNMK